jgi:hypothetical protein
MRTPEFGKPEGRTADPSTTLPRISCGTWWRWCTSCAFPLQKGAYAALSSAAWQEIRVRSGQDDNSSWKLYLAFPNKIVIPSEAEGSAVRPSGFPKFLELKCRVAIPLLGAPRNHPFTSTKKAHRTDDEVLGLPQDQALRMRTRSETETPKWLPSSLRPCPEIQAGC